MNEVWKEIEGTNGMYQVSNFGRVKSVSRTVKFGERYRDICDTILKPRLHKNGYYTVCLFGKKNRYIHRLVAETFIENPYNLPQINHKDEDKRNNAVWNLEWCDGLYNINYGSAIKRAIDEKSKRHFTVLNLDTGERYKNPLEAQTKTGIHHDSISRVCRNRKGTAGGYHWGYVKNGFSA